MIFRDLINFSKDAINLILKPAWKLLNSHLPIFTEVVAYNESISSLKDALGQDDDEEEEDEDEDDNKNKEREAGNESFSDEEVYGVEGMTLHLLELLSSLVLRGNVQALVQQGLMPLITSVSSYLLVQSEMEAS